MEVHSFDGKIKYISIIKKGKKFFLYDHEEELAEGPEYKLAKKYL